MLKLFRTHLKPFALACIAAALFTFLQVFAELSLPRLMSDIVDTGVYNNDIPYILNVGLQMLGWALFSMVCIVIAAFFSSRSAMGFGRNVRDAVFKKVEQFSIYDFEKFGTSSLITRATNDVQQLERVLQMGLTLLMMAPFMFIGSVFMTWTTSPELARIVFFVIPVLLAFVGVVIKFGLPLLRSLQARIDTLNRVTREGLTGIRVIRAYNKEDFEQRRFATANADLSETNVKVARVMGTLMPMAMLVLNAIIVILYWVGTLSVQTGGIQVGQLMAVTQYAMMILMSVMMLSMMFSILPRAMAAADRINAVLETEPSIVDAPDAAHREHLAAIPGAPLGEGPAEITFEDVTFTFEDAQVPSIEHLSFTLQPGKTIAVIGSTGSGKSTLINLIMRFFDPSSGRVLFNGVDIATITQKTLHDRMAYVPQKATLFSGTIESNIRYGREDATLDEIAYAAQIAQADTFICEKEGGYSTVVSQDGGNLSGGQRQRLAIARALVRHAGLYIFDDSFSALDFKTDARIRAALKNELRDATTLIVAQRVTLAMDADEVIVIDKGRVVGEGTHAELLETCDVYREIAASQLSDEELGLDKDAELAPTEEGR